MPLIYIHGVRHRQPEKLPKMVAKLSELVDAVRRKNPRIGLPRDFSVRAPYWGGDAVKPQLAGLVPLDAPRVDAQGRALDRSLGPRRGEADLASLDVVRDASDDDPLLFLRLLEETPGAELSEQDRMQLEAFLRASAGELGAVGNARARGAEDELVWRRNLPQRVIDLIDRTASRLIFDNEGARSFIRTAQDSCGLFMGDAMSYVIQRSQAGAQSPILARVLADFPRQGEPQTEPLILVTHSMGAAIAYDVLTAYRPELRVDCWISVGSQIGQFANLGLLATQPALHQGERIRGVGRRVRRWFNIYDRLDFLNYLTEPAFEDVRDVEYTNKRGPAFSHSWYFKEQPFWDLVQELLYGTLNENRPFSADDPGRS
jgi:hypothetical protein